MVKVSVLMPVYRTHEEYLREAISSILAQILLPYVIFHKVCRFFFQTKLTKSGKLQLKFFKIPISIKLFGN